jgi:hypothetical protein
VAVSWCLLLSVGIIAVSNEQFIYLSRPDFVSKKARPPLLLDDFVWALQGKWATSVRQSQGKRGIPASPESHSKGNP